MMIQHMTDGQLGDRLRSLKIQKRWAVGLLALSGVIGVATIALLVLGKMWAIALLWGLVLVLPNGLGWYVEAETAEHQIAHERRDRAEARGRYAPPHCAGLEA